MYVQDNITRFFALVILMLTKRQERCGRANSAKRGANHFQKEDSYPR